MSEIKVNKISPRTACGTTTLGDSGDTFTIPAGVTITNSGTAAGFGATGAASWDTTVKTTGFTAVSGVGYFVNTTAGAISVNLPAGTAGDVVAIKDYANTFDTNAVTLVQNGSDKIGGSAINSVLSAEGLAVTLVFVDSTQGWLVTDSGLQSEATAPEYITATGGTITTVCTDYKVHTFTGPGTFTVCSTGNPVGSDSVDYLVVAGGGGGGSQGGGGGGAGGMRFASTTYTAPVCSSPRTGTALPVSATGYPITVGGGGAGAASSGAGPGGTGSNGVNTTFSTITSTAGGGGGRSQNTTGPGNENGNTGGSGGGTGKNRQQTAAAGNTPPVSPSQGFPGGPVTYCTSTGAGGGGGAGVAGTSGHGPGTPPACGGSQPQKAGPGGDGLQININGTNTYYAGGGGGGSDLAGCTTSPLAGTGGQGGGGGGARSPGAPGSNNGQSGTVNTGGGGGGSEWETPTTTGGAGGSGIVIIRYKFQN